jgi:hypothetical protein
MWIGEAAGQGCVQIGELGMAFLLSALIGLGLGKLRNPGAA